ncbi:hypothetical protein CWI38_2393p0010 [Hamiltosporidium tvaerminnensis]|uniref:Leucine-rich repeat-containing protein n=1 Tax=Hamiltosporidium tvaerminnensis TaxID=1176355 RepID=A0A4Q9LJ11_9MICR|nr:hypothetical protein CWI38_2393p0010 [Hamiltosporidium tvaerminnensis]
MSLLHCNLILNDLNIIKNFEVLEDLNLTGCKFSNFGFFRLGSDCAFLNSLKILNLSDVEINIIDLSYLRNFKNLIKLSLKIHGSYYLQKRIV